MHQHIVTVIPIGGAAWRPKCSCRETGPIETSAWKAEQWGIDHRRKIDRIRLHLDKQPTLSVAHQLYEAAADNPELTDDQRALFRMLATEIRHRLYGPDDPPEQPPLFDLERNPHAPSPPRRKPTRPTGH